MTEPNQSSDPDAGTPSPLTADDYSRRYYYEQWQQYYTALWQQYYLQQHGGNEYQPATQQSSAYSHGGHLETLPDAPAEIAHDTKEVFLSYSTKNSNEAAFVCKKIETAGMRCWIAPRDLLAGTNFADNIETALNNAKLLILILSRESANSPWVEGEVNTAFSSGMPILVYQIDDVRPSGALKVMLEKFPTLLASGNAENDAVTLIYNAKILTGRVAATPAAGHLRYSAANVARAKSAGLRPAPKPTAPKHRRAPASAPAKKNSSSVALSLVVCLLCIIATILSAPIWFPLLQRFFPTQ